MFENEIVLWHVTSLLANKHLVKLRDAGLVCLISPFARDQTWWKARMETLHERWLQPRVVDWRDIYGKHWRYLCAYNDWSAFTSVVSIQVVLELGITTHELNARPLLEASQAGNIEAMLLLLETGAQKIAPYPDLFRPGLTVEVYKLLIERGFDYKNKRDAILRHALECACRHANLPALEALVALSGIPSGEMLGIAMRSIDRAEHTAPIFGLLFRSK